MFGWETELWGRVFGRVTEWNGRVWGQASGSSGGVVEEGKPISHHTDLGKFDDY